MGHTKMANSFDLTAGTAKVLGEFSEKLRSNKKAAALGTTPLALILSACGSSDSSSTTASNVLTLTKSADTYSASAVTGFSVTDSSTAKFDVADATSNSYEIKLDATGTGVLEFDFADAGDTVTLQAGSKSSGFTTLKVTDGTLDATNADLTGITRVEVASGIKISLAQIKEIPTIVASSATSEITVQVATEAEATELVSLISAGTVKVFADVNPIKLVAAPTATVTTETLTTKQTETTASVKPAAEAPAATTATDTATDTDTSTGTDDTTTVETDTTTTTTTGGGGGGGADVVPDFGLIKSGPGTYIVGTTNGDVTASASGDVATFTPTTGVAVTKTKTDITGLRVDDITVTTTSALANGMTVTGNGNMSLTALEGSAAADLSNITNTGTKIVNVGGDVTFTGDLGSFAVTVDTGKTLTTTTAKATGLTMTGAGGVALTALDATAAADLSNITVSGTKTANVADDVTFTGNLGTFGVTVDSGKTLTTTAAKVTGLTITGSGTVAISDVIAADIDTTNIAAIVDFSQADVTIATSKTLTVTAAHAATEVFSGAGTLAVTASSTDDSFTATAATLTIATGGGDDVLTAGAAAKITAADTINLGGGTADVISISADGSSGAVFDEAGYAGAETIRVTAHATTASTNAVVTLTHAANFDQDTIIDASAMSDSGADFTLTQSAASKVLGDLTVKASGGANTLGGGVGNDTFDFGAITQFTAADTVVAGSGADTIRLTADDSGTGGVLDDGNTGVQTIQIIESSTATHDAKLTLNYAGAVTDALTINASALTNSGAVFTLAIAGTAGNVDNVLTVIGGAGNDVLVGGDAADIITGGDGVDTMAGAGAADIFIFDADDSAAVSVSNDDSTGGDTISDFVKTTDKIQITGVLTNGFDASTDVLIGATGGATEAAAVAVKEDFVDGTYLVARDGVLTNGFDTAVKVFSSGSTAAFSSAAEAQAATMFNVTLATGGNTVVLGANDDTIVGGDGDDVITGKAGVDSITGGAGNDTFVITDTDDDGTAETYTGGDGTADKISITTTEVINLSNDTIATVETLDLAAGSVNNLGTTVTAAQLAAFTTITADASDKIIVNTLTGATVAGTAAVDNFDFASGDAAVTISAFGTSGTDILDVIGLDSGTYALLNESGGTITQTTHTAAATEGSTVAVADNKAILVEVADQTAVDSAADIVTALADGGVLDAIDFAVTSGNTALLAVGQHTTGTDVFLYRYLDNGSATAVEIAEITLVATVTGAADLINDLVAGNFDFS